LPIYNVKIGRNVEFDGVALKAAIRKGCERATTEYPLRSSVVHPITRKNNHTSCGIDMPAIHLDFSADNEVVEIEMIPKGSGSENNSYLKMAIQAERPAHPPSLESALAEPRISAWRWLSGLPHAQLAAPVPMRRVQSWSKS
jgi:tartrate dehydratase alpha subunit/fumarate hydratase class I-like protein